MKKILILGGSHRDIPLIKASQDLGYFVITLGNKDYYLGHKYSNKAYKINFNDLNMVKKIIEDENIDYILPGSGEESYLNTVKLAHELKIGNFDIPEVADLVHNKWKFKKFCLKNDISTPNGKFYMNDNDLIDLVFPIVVKPTNLSGGRGVEIVNSKEDLIKSLLEAKKVTNEIFLEEFIEGKLIAYSIFLKEQKIIYGFTGEDKTYLNKYLITSAFPCEVKEETLQKMKFDIEKIAKLLNLVDGMFHLQIMIKDDIPYIIDVTRRIPGDLYPYLIEYCDGVEYSKAVVKAYTTGLIDDEFDAKYEKQNFVIRHCVMPNRNGIYKNIIIDDSIKDKILYRLDLVKKDYMIEDYFHAQIAIIFLDASNNKFIVENINHLIQVEVKESI
ncbi:ATP-grasp domain-containing protein [Aliarcobacter butzleri]|uniref:ATP-grasp domain-containing protein n=1 Tax=Aliarcobacter butzleri TaxID=28197 RepID=UPI0021B38C64|nr:ATP-grasp domain-containing protein [Aliarcobacter butzleri]MCT7584217.1 ATP-grasp domain-containing protein [Aliarcobacter butzleri]MCT7603994.1 ATP-grasp domain-containing protein [Aliarcobacter butzleri]